MPYRNVHAARQKDPSGYERFATKVDQGGKGIDFIIGFKKGGGSDVTSIHFDAKKFTAAQAKAWLTKHQFSSSVEPAQKESVIMGKLPTQEAVINELSYERLRELVCEALCESYPWTSSGGSVYPEMSCYYINQLWQERALVKKSSYGGSEDLPEWAMVDFTVADDLESVELGELVPIQITATPLNGGDSYVLDEALEPSFDFNEAGKRHSTGDAAVLNTVLRSLLTLIGQSDLHEETMNAMGSMVSAASTTPMESKESGDELTQEAVWSSSFIDSLPDSSFAYIEPGGKKDKEGKTTPRSLRHLPFKDSSGKVDLPHLRNALSRLPQTNISSAAKAKAQGVLNRAAKKAGVGQSKEAHEHATDEIIESWSGMPGETISENFSTSLIESKFDSTNLVLEGTVVLGPTSLNGRIYPTEVQKKAVGVFEGAKAYMNHPTKHVMSEARDVKDYIGIHKNVRVKGDKTYSDLHLVNNETVQKHILPILEDKTHHSSVGNSIVARATMEKGKDGIYTVTEIHAARSIDLVSEPGTTKGLFESHSPTTEEKEMELKDLTIESLMKDRPDLIESLLKNKNDQDEKNALKAEVERLVKENAEQAKKIIESDLRETKRQLDVEIDTLLANAKFPDSVKFEVKEGVKQFKPLFRNVLLRCENVEERKAVIADWETTYKDVPAKAEPKIPVAVESAIDFGKNGNLGMLYTAIKN